jgi:hypothetical protein
LQEFFVSHRFFLPLQRGRKIAGLGIRGGQGVDVAGVAPFGDLARFGGQLQREFAIPELGFRARAEQPRFVVVRQRTFRIDCQRRIIIGE